MIVEILLANQVAKLDCLRVFVTRYETCACSVQFSIKRTRTRTLISPAPFYLHGKKLLSAPISGAITMKNSKIIVVYVLLLDVYAIGIHYIYIQTLMVSIETATSVTNHFTYNVLASTSSGRNDSIIVVNGLNINPYDNNYTNSVNLKGWDTPGLCTCWCWH